MVDKKRRAATSGSYSITVRLFTELLSEPEFTNLEAGIVLQAYLPDTFDALTHLAEFAKKRVAEGGSHIKIRIVKGANLSMEHVQGEIHGWPAAPYATKDEVDANYYRLLDYIYTALLDDSPIKPVRRKKTEETES